MSDGSSGQEGSLVDEELCGDQEPSVDGDTNMVLQEACMVPCPGQRSSTASTEDDNTSRISIDIDDEKKKMPP